MSKMQQFTPPKILFQFRINTLMSILDEGVYLKRLKIRNLCDQYDLKIQNLMNLYISITRQLSFSEYKEAVKILTIKDKSLWWSKVPEWQ
jgi:hypothetical protein